MTIPPVSDETAKAIQEASKTAGKVVDAARATGAYFAKILDTLPQDLVGVVAGEWLHHGRMVIRARLAERVETILKRRGIKPEECEVSPSVLLPAVHAAQDENRAELHELFARLIANAVDPLRASSVRREFIATVRAMEPLDARLLLMCGEIPTYPEWLKQLRKKFPEAHQVWSGPDVPFMRVLADADATTGSNLDEMELALQNLRKLDCIMIGERGDRQKGNLLPQLYRAYEDKYHKPASCLPERVFIVILTPFGRELLRALEL